MADMAHYSGLVAAKEHKNPFEYCDVVTTTTHKTLRGPRGAMILSMKEDRLHNQYHSDKKLKDGSPKKLSSLIDSAVFPGMQGGPLDHVIAAKAVAFKEALSPVFAEYQMNVVKNARVLAEHIMQAGINLVSGGTDNHMMLLDLQSLGITGKEAEDALGRAGITVNKNAIPFDPQSPLITSGIRLGTPAVTSRGMKEAQMITIAGLIADALKNRNNENMMKDIGVKAGELCSQFPLYQD